MASCCWLVEPGTTPSLVSPSHPPAVAFALLVHPRASSFFSYAITPPSVFSPSFSLPPPSPPPPSCPGEKTRRVSSRRVDPHKRGRAFLMRSIDCQHPPPSTRQLFSVTLLSLVLLSSAHCYIISTIPMFLRVFCSTSRSRMLRGLWDNYLSIWERVLLDAKAGMPLVDVLMENLLRRDRIAIAVSAIHAVSRV